VEGGGRELPLEKVSDARWKIDYFPILAFGLELACNGGSCARGDVIRSLNRGECHLYLHTF